MILKTICPACGAENLIDIQGGAAAGLRCGVCGEPLDAGARLDASSRKSAFGRPESGNAPGQAPSAFNSSGGAGQYSSGADYAAGGSSAGANYGPRPIGEGYGGPSLEPDDGGPVYRERGPAGYNERYGGGGQKKRHTIPVFGQIMIVVIALTFISSVYVNKNERDIRVGTRVKICVFNMKTLEGAMELYLMENDLGTKKYLPPEFDIGRLVMNGYLRVEPKCPERGEYRITLHKTGKNAAIKDITCTKHGSLFSKTGDGGF